MEDAVKDSMSDEACAGLLDRLATYCRVYRGEQDGLTVKQIVDDLWDSIHGSMYASPQLEIALRKAGLLGKRML